MKKIHLALFLLFCSALEAGAVDPFEVWSDKTGGVVSWRASRDQALDMFREHFFTDLPAKEQAVFDQISFVDDPKIELGVLPHASKKLGRRFVSFPTAFLIEVRSFVIATHIESRFGRDGLTLKYARQCSKAAKDQREGKTYEWLDPLTMADLDKDEVRFFFSKDEQGMIYTMTSACVGFVLAHEVAHHVLGDLDKTDRSIAQLREAEIHADDWALDVFHANGLLAYNAVHIFDYLFSMEGLVFGNHEKDTHPRPAERGLNLLRFERGFIKNESSQGSDQQAFIQRIDYEIKCAQKVLEAEKVSPPK